MFSLRLKSLDRAFEVKCVRALVKSDANKRMTVPFTYHFENEVSTTVDNALKLCIDPDWRLCKISSWSIIKELSFSSRTQDLSIQPFSFSSNMSPFEPLATILQFPCQTGSPHVFALTALLQELPTLK